MVNPHIPHCKVVMASRTPVTESEVSITHLCQLCSSCYAVKTNQNCMKSTSVTKAATINNTNGAVRPQVQVSCPSIIVWNVKYPLHFFVNNSQLVTNQNLVKKHQVTMMISITHAKEAITCNHQFDTFRCQQRWMEYTV